MADLRRETSGMPPRVPAGTRRIVAQLAKLGPALPGTLTERYTRCGRAGCRCMADPPRPHGPYWSWTRKVANKTVTRYLSEEQYQRYRPWFENARRARQLLAELEALGLASMDQEPRTATQAKRATNSS